MRVWHPISIPSASNSRISSHVMWWARPTALTQTKNVAVNPYFRSKGTALTYWLCQSSSKEMTIGFAGSGAPFWTLAARASNVTEE